MPIMPRSGEGGERVLLRDIPGYQIGDRSDLQYYGDTTK